MNWNNLAILLFLLSYGKPTNTQQRIAGGKVAQPGEFPYMVYLESARRGFFCGGSIVTKFWVLTAANCIYGTLPSEISVTAGTNVLDQGGTKYSSAKLITHPSYTGLPIYFLNMDVGLVKVTKEIVFGPLVQPVMLGSSYVPGGYPAILTGWGASSKIDKSPNQNLKSVTFKTLGHVECYLASLPFILSRPQLCAITSMHEGGCYGDSGGPLVVNGVQVGVASNEDKCGDRSPFTFARINYHLAWIRNVVKNN